MPPRGPPSSVPRPPRGGRIRHRWTPRHRKAALVTPGSGYLAPVLHVAVHGGVSGTAKVVPDLTACARAGADAPSALDAVELAVIALEDHPELNAGYGACLTNEGTIEL